MHRHVGAAPVVRGRNRNIGVNVTHGRTDRPVALDHKGSSGESSRNCDARRSDRRVTGERLLRRLEATLNGLPARIADAGATPGRRPASCENTLGAMPHQALWAGGCSRLGRCGPSGNGHARCFGPWSRRSACGRSGSVPAASRATRVGSGSTRLRRPPISSWRSRTKTFRAT